MSQVSMLTLAQEGVTVAPSNAPAAPAAPAGAPAAAPGTPGATALPPAGASGTPASGSKSADPFGGSLFIFVILIAFMVFIFFTNRREKKKQEETLNSLKKGDKVTTVGGLVATIVEVRENEVVLESSGNRLTFVRTAVQSVLNSSESKS